MEFIPVILIAAVVFLLCWLADKGFSKLFRGRAQHRSGLSVRLSKRYGSTGIVVAFFGAAGLLTGIAQRNTAMMVGSGFLIVAGAGLAIYYLSTGIFYDDDSFLYSTFGKKSRFYRYDSIAHQQLYRVQGGHYIIELHMSDGTAVMVQTQMDGSRDFLSHAHRRWCCQRGEDFRSDPENLIYFPSQEGA